MGNYEVGHLNLGAGRPVLPGSCPASMRLSRTAASTSGRRCSTRSRPASGPMVDSTSSAYIGRAVSMRNNRRLVALVARQAGERAERAGACPARWARHAAPVRARFRRRPRATTGGGPIRMRGLASIGGRYYAMDRDRRWDRIPSMATTPRSSAASAATRPARRPPSRRPMPAARTNESSAPTVIDGVEAPSGPGRRHRPRQLPRRSTRRTDPRPGRRSFSTRSRRSGRPLRGDHDRVRDGLPVEVAFPPEQARSLAQTFSEAGWRPVPRRRDREVRSCDLLLQRRRRAAWPGEEQQLVRARRWRPTTSRPR